MSKIEEIFEKYCKKRYYGNKEILSEMYLPDFEKAFIKICELQREMCRKAYQEQQRKYAYNSDDENEEAILNNKLEDL